MVKPIEVYINEQGNNLVLRQGEDRILIGTADIDSFIQKLWQHCSSEGDGESFRMGEPEKRIHVHVRES